MHGVVLDLPSNFFPDPYPQVYEDVKLLPFDPHGWYPHETIFEEIFQEREIKYVIEVGSWLGWSTRHLASLVQEDGAVFAVDHWKGSEEHFREERTRNLIPILYNQFLSNVIHCGLTGQIIPVRMDSLAAAELLKKLTVQIDLVYIDAAHDYNSVYADLCAWYPYVKNHGILCGDDWNIGDLQRAVIRFSQENNLIIYQNGGFWRFL